MLHHKIISLTVFLGFIVFAPLAAAAGLKDAKPVFNSGNWKVLRSTDVMTDATTCTGIYKENYSIQLVENRLFVSVRGGLQSITLRFGDAPANPLRLPEKMEKDVGMVIISGTDFYELTKTNRLRLQVLTLVSGIFNEDLDISGIQEAVENIKSGCPVPEVASKSQSVPAQITPAQSAPVQSTSAPESLCSDQLISRMKANGIKALQIKKVCQK